MVHREPDDVHPDLELARSVLAGSLEAWHRFIHEHSGIIYAVCRRHLRDEDDARTAYVETLDRLHKGLLDRYSGGSSLSTWLVFVARSTALDHLRSRFGRRGPPAAIREMSESEQQVFRLFYLEGMSFEGVLHWAARGGEPMDPDALIALLERMDGLLSRRKRRRLDYDLHASSVGASSGRLLEYLDIASDEYGERGRLDNPEYRLMEKEARETAGRIRELIEELPEEEYRVVTLRFDRGWTAKRIADELGLEGRRRVYTLVERALRRLRGLLGPGLF